MAANIGVIDDGEEIEVRLLEQKSSDPRTDNALRNAELARVITKSKELVSETPKINE